MDRKSRGITQPWCRLRIPRAGKVIILWVLICSFLGTSFAKTSSIKCANRVLDKDGAGVNRKARIIEKPNPKRTEKARLKGTEGIVLLSIVLDASRKVTGINVIEGLPDGLTDAAIETARLIKFDPALEDGCPVSIRVRVEYVFKQDK